MVHATTYQIIIGDFTSEWSPLLYFSSHDIADTFANNLKQMFMELHPTGRMEFNILPVNVMEEEKAADYVLEIFDLMKEYLPPNIIE